MANAARWASSFCKPSSQAIGHTRIGADSYDDRIDPRQYNFGFHIHWDAREQTYHRPFFQ